MRSLIDPDPIIKETMLANSYLQRGWFLLLKAIAEFINQG